MGAHPSIMKVEELLEREELNLVRSPNTGRVKRRDWTSCSDYCPQFNSSPRKGSRVRVRDYASSPTTERAPTQLRRTGSAKELRRGHAWSGLDSTERLYRARRGVHTVTLPKRKPARKPSQELFLGDPFVVEQVLQHLLGRDLWRAARTSQSMRAPALSVWRERYGKLKMPVHMGGFYRAHNVMGHRFVLDIKYHKVQQRPQLLGTQYPVCVAWDVEKRRWVLIRKCPRILSETAQALNLLADVKMQRHFERNEMVLKLHDIVLMGGESGYGGDHADAYIMTEAPDTSLYNLIHPNRARMGTEHVQWFMSRLLRGLHALHCSGVFHLDLSVFSILLFRNCDLRIINVDWELQLPGLSTTDPKPFQRWYKAPEVLFESAGWHSTPQGKAAADMWAIGCVLAEMLSGKVLFEGQDHLHQLDCIINILGVPTEDDLDFLVDSRGRAFFTGLEPSAPTSLGNTLPDAPSSALDLVRRLLDYHPLRRLSALEALQHSFLADVYDPEENVPTQPEFATSFAVEALTRAPHSVAEGLWSMLLEEGVQVDSSFWVT